MIIVRLSSGIGNQLFQYSFAQYLSFKFKHDVYFDLNRFNNDAVRSCEIDILSQDIAKYKNNKLFSNYLGIQYRLKKTLFIINPLNKYITDDLLLTNYEFNNSFLYYFDGYWQSDYYITQIDNWRSLFIPKQEIPNSIRDYLNLILTKESVSIHIRRGDYFSSQYINRYGVCTEEYYLRAIELITTQIKNCLFIIFSDDLEWVKYNIKLPLNSILIKNEKINSFWYIYLMSQCKHNIISNSTFSWWGAFFNNNDSKMVLSPKKWLLDSDKTIALESWIKI